MGRKKKTTQEFSGVPISIDELPDFLPIKELLVIVQQAESSTIVNSDDYVYFCIAPSFEEVSFCKMYQDKNLSVFMVLNFKNNPIGYFVYFEKIPVQYRVSEFGASFFFANIKGVPDNFKTVDVVFSDSKFRLLGFEQKAYFASVKWKSINPGSKDLTTK